jgi:lipoprotein-anchoring transpeptidase ErfK/SrfK
MLFPFSRREFLKVSSAGMLAFVLADLRLDHALAGEAPIQGRSTFSGVDVYTDPAYAAKKIWALGRDEIVSIDGELQGDLSYGNPFNDTWYHIDGDGYVYSGSIQPVQTNHQKPVFNIPEAGALGELTVPFSDTRRDSSVFAQRGYRIYYTTTHWIQKTIVNRDEKSIWYKLYDRLTQETLYIPAHDMRVIPSGELSLLSSDIPDEEKRMYVDLETRTVTAFEGEKAVFVARCASGAKGTETPLGEYRTYHKGPSVHMTNQGDGTENTYHLPGVPWVSFFTGTGVAFHGTYWHNDYGRPSSRGCVNLTSSDAKFLYRWTNPEVPRETPYLSLPGEGTRVQVVVHG